MADAADGFTSDNAELALCVQINLDNIAKMSPGVISNPAYALSKMQLDALVKRLEAE